MNDLYVKQFKSFTEIEPFFYEIGIQKEDKVISIPDFTINGSLYLMQRKGYTEFGSDFSKEETFFSRIEQGARYLIINDSTVLNQPVLEPFTKVKIGGYKNILVYDLSNLENIH